MPAIATRSPDNPHFARVVAVRGLPAAGEFTFDLAPDADEAAALARLLDARSVRKMRLVGTLRAEGAGWVLEADLGATVVQTCVVTLDPVSTRIDTRIRRRFLPEAGDQGGEIVVAPEEEDDEIDPLGDRIDLGLVAIEALALALPDYPRKAGAALPSAGEGDGDGEDAPDAGTKPFAGLAALRDRLEGDKKE